MRECGAAEAPGDGKNVGTPLLPFKTLRQRQTLLPAVSCSSLLGLWQPLPACPLLPARSSAAEQPLLPSNLFLAQRNDLLASCQDQNSLGSIYLFCAHTGRGTSQ